MADIPDVIGQLVERFDRNLAAYKSPQYNETELRVEFVNPFWSALGWDVDNKAGYVMAYRDVIHEDAVKVGTATKAPDYCFRIGGARKFFLETKRPARDLKADPAPAYQLRRYGWSAKLPLSVLTDFEELSVYDCRLRPRKTDKASQARILCINFKDYPAKWEELSSIFSREAVLKGSFDRYVESAGGKRGTAEVDAEFLREIEGWRDALARNIALRNPRLTDRELNFAVQMTIDRIIFLRMCEDRGIELYGRLQALCGGPRIYPRLVEIYRSADERYNSGLFHFEQEKDQSSQPDELTPRLTIDDKALKDILSNLYYPDSPYEFRILPPEILGNVYEQFLGKVIRLTTGHQAKIEEKPEVRKAGGVYYTPSYIVDYIVKNTVGKLLGDVPSVGAVPRNGDSSRLLPTEQVSALRIPSPSGEGRPACNPAVPDSIAGRGEGPAKSLTSAQVSRLRILDPACGSGSFLLGAYQYLLDWHLKVYLAEKEKTGKISTVPPEAGQRRRKSDMPVMYQGQGGDWILTTIEKKRILLNNIYGVDIDPQAVEVTKLALLLKVLENENQDSLRSQLTLWRERALPDLSGNIKCGNSLIGPDFYQNRQLPLLAEEDKYRINAFDWNDDKQGFGEIMRAGGFDAIIGNPPYVVVGPDLYPISIMDYLRGFEVAQYKQDLFHLFIQRGIELLRSDGCLGFIVPNTWLTLKFTDKLRRYILQHAAVSELVLFGHRVFPSADVHTILLFLEKGATRDHTVLVRSIPTAASAQDIECSEYAKVHQKSWLETTGFVFETRLTGNEGGLAARIMTSFPRLDTLARASLGCQAYNRSKHTAEQIANRVFHSPTKAGKDYLPELAGKDVSRYFITKARGEWIKYGPWLHDYRTMDWLTGPRILIREIPGQKPYSIHACYVEETYCHYKTILNVNPSEVTKLSMKYLTGILNSRLVSFLYPFVSNKMVAQSFPRLSVGDVKKLPIRPIEFSNAADKSRHDRMVALVNSMLDLHKKLPAAKTPDEQTRLEREISATDKQIDALVYELYGLNEKEVAIVEQQSGINTSMPA